jgi:outer membrane cobalamin receptor
MFGRIIIAVFGALLSCMVLASAVLADSSAVQLKEVVVTATKTEKRPQDVTQSVTVITGEEIRNSSATTVAEAIKSATSVNIREAGSNASLSTVSLRGASYQQVLVLLDGKRLNSASAGGFDLSTLAVSLDNIERIEIVRGSASALYGADAVGGVVNIITKKPVAATSITLNGTRGPHGYEASGAGLSGRADSIYYALAGGKERSHGERENSAFDQIKASVKLGADINAASSIEASVDYLDKELDVPGHVLFPTPLAQQTNENSVYGLSYTVAFSKELDADLNVYQTDERLTYKNLDPAFPEDSKHRSITSGTEVQVNWIANSWNLISVGGEAREDTMASSDAGDHRASISAGYLQDEMRYGEVFILVLGGRTDNHSVYGEQLSPRASMRILDPKTNTILRASWGESFRAPTLNDLYWPDTTWAAGNPDLRPETAEEYEVGVEQTLGNGSMIRMTEFDRKVTDMIEWQPDAAFKYSPVNIGKAHIKGFEVEARFAIAEPVVLTLNYTEIDPVNELTGEKIYYTIPHVQIGGTLQMTLDKSTKLSFDGRRVKNYVKPGEEEWDYYTVNGKISGTLYANKDGRGDIFVGMKNMFNRKYETVQGYPMPGPEVYGGVAFEF